MEAKGIQTHWSADTGFCCAGSLGERRGKHPGVQAASVSVPSECSPMHTSAAPPMLVQVLIFAEGL